MFRWPVPAARPITPLRQAWRTWQSLYLVGLSLVAGSGMVEGLNSVALAEKQSALIKPDLIEITEIIHAIEFFAAPDARNITGQTVYFGGVK